MQGERGDIKLFGHLIRQLGTRLIPKFCDHNANLIK